MKQQIRELLERATPGDYSPRMTHSCYGYSHGDTYHQYTQRCRMSGITPKEFHEWLAFELEHATRRGPHLRLDDQQRVEAMRPQAG
jgi:hypothetical protein